MSLFDVVTRAGDVFDRAQLLFNDGKLNEAERLFKEAHLLRPSPRTHFGIGLVSAARGRRSEALDAYRSALEGDFKFWQARINYGLLLREDRQLEAAMQQHLLAYALAPGEPAVLYNLAETHLALGNSSAARALIEHCLAHFPDFELARRAAQKFAGAPPWPAPTDQGGYREAFLRAVELNGKGETAAALAAFAALAPAAMSDPLILTNYGNAQSAAGHLETALELHREAIRQDARLALAHHNAGFVLHQLGRRGEAIAAYTLALTFQPREPATWLNLGHALRDEGRLLEALDAFRVSAELFPDRREALIEIARIARTINRWEIALHAYKRLEKLSPTDPFVANEAGACLFGLNRLDEAQQYFTRATEIAPNSPWGYANLAGVALHRNDFPGVCRNLRQALKFDPDNLPMLVSLAHACQQACDWADFSHLCARIEVLLKRGFVPGQPLSVLPFPLFSMPLDGLTLADHLACAARYGEDNFGKLRQLRKALPPRATDRERPIRVGYLSCDYHEHPVAHVLAQTIELHDRTRFEIYAFAHGKSPEDRTRQRLRRAFDHFIDIADLTDEAAAEKIREHDIDILVDLGGFTRGARGGILAMRAAPVQVNYIGYPGTLGTDYVDYLIADEVVIPPELEAGYTETVKRMPHCYLPSDRTRPVPAAPSRAALGLPDDAIVFCAFNSPHKITPDLFSIWCRLLVDVPGSVLWMRSDNAAINANLLAEAAKRGVAADRIVFAPRAETADHFARIRQSDLMLDTFPYTSHSTASDSLWSGVPIVTRIGETFASRVAASLLRSCGLPELVAHTAEDYYRLAKDLASDKNRLTAIKAHLNDNRLTLPAFDSLAHTRDLEQIYLNMISEQGH